MFNTLSSQFAITNSHVGAMVTTCCIFLLLSVIFQLLIAIYNITLHPLSKIPGPKIAAAITLYSTFWCYYQRRSIYYRKVQEMHEKYGSIVRVRPNEVSLSNPADYEKIYNVRSRYTKDSNFYTAVSVNKGMFGTSDNESHRMLRAPWLTYFSSASVNSLDGMMNDKVELLCQQAEKELCDTGVIPLQVLIHALMRDIVSEYTLPQSLDLLRSPSFGKEAMASLHQGANGIWFKMMSPSICGVLEKAMTWLNFTGFRHDEFFGLYQRCTKHVLALERRSRDMEKVSESSSVLASMITRLSSGSFTTKNHTTIKSITDDIYTINGASVFNPPGAACMILWGILSNRHIYNKVRCEILAAYSNGSKSLSYSTLKTLPFLTSCVNEGLRLFCGPIGRLPRVVPEPGETFRGYHLPPKTIVGSWTYVMHHNPEIWGHDHKVFNPDRWLNDKDLSRHLYTFGKDHRQCPAKELSLAITYKTIAALLRKYDSLEVCVDYPANDLCDHFAAVIPVGGPQLAVRQFSKQRT